MATLQERAKKIFANNPSESEAHFTSDGMPFFVKAAAEAHASRFKDRSITTINKEGSEATATAAPAAEVSEEEMAQVATNPVAETAPATETPKEVAAEAAPEVKEEIKPVTPKKKK